MGAVELLAAAASFSLLAGWRLYAAVLVAGLAMRLGWLPLPTHLAGLDVLANPWVLAIAALGALAELVGDKIMFLDSLWDTVHGLVRPLGGAVLALAIVDPSNPAWQVAVLLLGGGAALATHGAKATTRAVVNISPEPVSNATVSTAEDLVVAGGLALALAHPLVALALILALLGLVTLLVLKLRRLFRRRAPPPAGPG